MERFDITTGGITFGLTLTLGVYAYLAKMPLNGSKLLFVLVVSWGMVVALRSMGTVQAGRSGRVAAMKDLRRMPAVSFRSHCLFN